MHVGIAGAKSLDAGTIVVGTESLYCDVIDEHATLPRVSRVEVAPELVARVCAALPAARAMPIATCALRRIEDALAALHEAVPRVVAALRR